MDSCRLLTTSSIAMDKHVSPDLLSDLPLGIIHTVLSFVPIRDAVRTSIMSRQWRFLWTSLPHLTFDYKNATNDRYGKKLLDSVNQALLLHEGPIHKFELHLPTMAMPREKCHYMDQWLLFLSRRNIRVLVLDFFHYYSGFPVHSSLYSCKYLTHLELHVRDISPPPSSFKGFLFLKSLYIFIDEVSSRTIESIVAHSPLLEKFTINGYVDSEMRICAPNLKYFHFVSVSFHLFLYTPLLEEFIGDFYTPKHLPFLESSVFCHLRIIKLSTVTFNALELTKAVIRLVTRSPNLQKLDLESFPCWKYDAPETACISFWDTESVLDFTYDSLKVIKLKNFGCGINETKLIIFLLARSAVLERMIYKPRSSLSDQELLNLTAELLSYRRASANAEIVIDN